VKYKDIQD